MTALPEAVEAKLRELMVSLVVDAGDPEAGPLRSINTRTFASAEDVTRLLAEFKAPVPAGFLSMPAVEFIGPKAVGVIHHPSMVLTYGLVFAFATRADDDERTAEAYPVFDKTIAALGDSWLSSITFPPGWQGDFVNLLAAQFVRLPTITALWFAFSLRVRGRVVSQ